MSLTSWLTNSPTSKRKHDSTESTPRTPSKKFCKKLAQTAFDWYVKDDDDKWHCCVCRTAQLDTAYARGHDSPAKTTNHTRHGSSDTHIAAVTKTKLAKLMPMKKMIEDKITKDEQHIINYLKAAYHIAKRELPKEEFSHMIDLTDSLGVETIEGRQFTYKSDDSLSDFHSAIADVILEEKLSEVESAGSYCIILDESTDRINQKRLLIFLQYFHGSVQTCLLQNVELTSGAATADIIVSAVLDTLKKHNIDKLKLIGVGTDGASVMTGCVKGVVVQLQQKANPALVGIHCAAHRCSLASSQVAKMVPELERYNRTIASIFYYFSSSALRSNKLREVQTLLNMPTLKFAQLNAVRWLSLGGAVEILYRTYPALVSVLDDDESPVSKGLLKEVKQYKFIGLTHMLMDVLPFLTKLSKVFQTDVLDFSRIKPPVMSTCDALSDMLVCEGSKMDKLDFFVQQHNETFLYQRPNNECEHPVVKSDIGLNIDGFSGFDKTDTSISVSEDSPGVELSYYLQQKDSLKSIMSNYVGHVVSNLKERFSDISLIEKMNVLTPVAILEASSSDDFVTFGLNDLLDLCEHFGLEKHECRSQYLNYKRLVVGSYPDKKHFNELVQIIDNKHFDTLPNLLVLLKTVITLPVSSVTCERGFSTQNRIKSKHRTSMNNQTLNDLMRISEDGPDACNFNFKKALLKWKSAKSRKVFQFSNSIRLS